ncbi:uncharacterized protein LOC113147161 [Cyclospora cayetanensis]|uniref:Uncharacterized protein LOC113147161 n=1 Tax=Cyclospora cayetanensis TaxID=88456 RepID=A0A6P6RXA4_9EIME|nr:uncharacterized protein LOC113147161 [Cyclospora cayetanensis]
MRGLVMLCTGLAAAAVAGMPNALHNKWRSAHFVLVEACAALQEALGLERLVLGMHVTVAALALLFCSLSSLLLGVSPRVPTIRLVCGSLLLGGPLGLCTWAIARVHTKATKQILFYFLLAAERSGRPSGRALGTETVPNTDLVERTNGPAPWKKFREFIARADPVALLRGSFSSSAATSQQQLLERLSTGDMEAGFPIDCEDKAPEAQPQLQQLQGNPLYGAEPVFSVSSYTMRLGGEHGYKAAPSDSEGEDLDEGKQVT